MQMTFATAPSVAQHVKSGRLRPLAVTGARPTVLFPELPTVSATGLPGYEAGSMFGLLAPVKTPDSIVRRLHQDSARFLESADGKERFLNIGVETAGGTPEQLAAAIKSEMSRMGKVIKDAGIRGE